jgi:hypothetical protein
LTQSKYKIIHLPLPQTILNNVSRYYWLASKNLMTRIRAQLNGTDYCLFRNKFFI